MSKLKLGLLQVGRSPTANLNFHIRNLLDGLLRITRGFPEAPIADVVRVNPDNSVEFPGGLANKNQCTAWVNFNGTGTVAIRDSYNVSSITDNGTGNYTINFATAMTNANYAVTGILGANDTTTGESIKERATPARNTSGVSITTAASDFTTVQVIVFGGK